MKRLPLLVITLISSFTLSCDNLYDSILQEMARNAPPNAPAGLVLDQITASTAQLSWQAATDPNEGDVVTGYNLYYSLTNGTGYVLAGTSTLTTGTLTGLSGNTTYYFIVRATDMESAESKNSNEVKATTGIPNTNATANPVFAPAPGTYASAQSVTITCATAGATIRYTIDGTAPSATTGNVYSGPVAIAASCTLQAIAYLAGLTDSAVVAGTYTVTNAGTAVADPVFTPAPGTYTAAQTVSITCATGGATIRYTTDGSVPSPTAGIVYGAPVAVTASCTLRAIAYLAGSTDSAVVAGIYTVTAPATTAAPVFATAPGTYGNNQSVTITCATPGATIRFTTDGSDPSRVNGNEYTAPVSITTSTTLRAMAYVAAWSSDTDSGIAAAGYTLVTSPPVPSIAFGSFAGPQTVTLSSATADATIRYTTDGTTPTPSIGTLYSGAIDIPVTCHFQAIAYKSGYAPSTLLDGTYTVMLTTETPMFNIPGGTYNEDQLVYITGVPTEATIRYTTNDAVALSATEGDLYTTGPITISSSCTLRAIAYRLNYQNSPVQSQAYTLETTTPVPDLAAGTYITGQTVHLSFLPADATIYYTLDGTSPTTATNLYGGSIAIGTTCTLRAIAVRNGYTSGTDLTVSYTITGMVSEPAFSPEANTYNDNIDVSITSLTPGAEIRYTTDGTTPTPSSGTLYQSGTPVIISGNSTPGLYTTLKAIAYVPGWPVGSESPVHSADYVMEAATPAFSPEPAGTYTSEQSITITTGTTDADIYYTTDGTTPGILNGTLYAGPVPLTMTTRLIAVAVKSGYIDSMPTDMTYTFQDLTAGNGGSMIPFVNGPTSLWLTWNRATDDTTPPELLQYKIVRSTVDNISTPLEAGANGTVVQDWTTDLSWNSQGQTSWEIEGLTIGSPWYINVLVTDGTNIVAYTRVGRAVQSVAPMVPNVNGIVTSMAIVSNVVFFGGGFTRVNVHAYGAAFNSSFTTGETGTTAIPLRIDGIVRAVAPDGKGGWYIGGDFTYVNEVKRNHIARIYANGTLHAWDPDADGPVKALAVSGTTVYAGGSFQNIGGEARTHLAALRTSDGKALLAWDPKADGPVNAIAVWGSSVFVGGAFTTIGLAARNNLAALQASDGTAMSGWSPNPDGAVNALALAGSGTTLCVGGSFAHINGTTTCNNLVFLNTANGQLTKNPNVNGAVNAIAVYADRVYVGGVFTTVSGLTRNNLALLSASTGTVDGNWDPNAGAPANCAVNSLAVSNTGSTVYVGGYFKTMRSTERNCIAELDNGYGYATSWDPNPVFFNTNIDNTVHALAVYGTSVFAGGAFHGFGGQKRHYLASVTNTGSLTGWNPIPNSTVSALLVSGNTLYVGGAFTSFGESPSPVTPRSYLAAFDTTTGTLLSWNPIVDNIVNALATNGTTVFAGGVFNSVNSIPTPRVAGINGSSGALLGSWNQNLTGNNAVYALAFFGTTLYAGGDFTVIGGSTYSRIAPLNAATGQANASWNQTASGANNAVHALALSADGQTLYAGGMFTMIGTNDRMHLAALNCSTGAVVSGFNPGTDRTVKAILCSGTTLYIGGEFTTVGVAPLNRLASVMTDGTVLATWNPDVEGPANAVVDALALTGDNKFLYLGGIYFTNGGKPRLNAGVINASTGALLFGW